MLATMPWIKLYVELLDDPKLGRMPATQKWHFVSLCLLAGECDAEGYLVNGAQPLTVDDIAWRLREDPASLGASLERLSEAGLVIQEGEAWLVVNFAARQGRPQHEKRRAWRERKRRQREREADSAGTGAQDPAAVTRDGRVTPAPVPAPETETEAEIEAEGRGEREDAAQAAAGAAPARPAPARGPEPGPRKPGLPLTRGQARFLEIFEAKRYASSAQRDAVLALEQEHGTAKLLEAATWAAERGLGLGRAVHALRTALPTWGQKQRGKPARAGPADRDEPAGFAAIRELAKEEGWEEFD